ncbi:hypothetical protein KIPB_015884, partial [Kipferlia bialata]|eukprot:g15884.t1
MAIEVTGCRLRSPTGALIPSSPLPSIL